jgi:CubicO group peptidase (beta-lactamase class C family)
MERSTLANSLLDLEVATNVPGVAVVVVARGEVVLLACRGLADLANGIPVTPDTAFDLASVSKQFTAVAIQMLAQRGLLFVHDRVDQHVSEWWGYGLGRPLVLTDLLCHTSGIPNYSEIWRNAKADAAERNADYLERLHRYPPRFLPGSQSEYSNSNYILLAEVVERITGRSLRRFLAEEVFALAGLTNTCVQDTPEFPVPWRARGYKRRSRGRFDESEFLIHLVGHSHVFSTAADLGRYYQALWSCHILSPEHLNACFCRGRLDNGEMHEYGFGWYDDSSSGRPSMGHGGYWDGFRNYVRRFAEADVTIAVMSNDEDRVVENLVTALAEIYLPLKSE